MSVSFSTKQSGSTIAQTNVTTHTITRESHGRKQRIRVTVRVPADGLAAYLTLEQNPPTPFNITVEDIYEALTIAKVEYGVMLDRIDNLIIQQQLADETLIAAGKPPAPGQHGTIRYLLPSLQPNTNQQPMFDEILAVRMGEALAERTTPQVGQNGISVFGRPISPADPLQARLPAGEGSKSSPLNKNQLVAAVDGFPFVDKTEFDQVLVLGMTRIEGDVDETRGDLDIDGSVHITGSVKSGRRVKARGHIIVRGHIESCYLNAGGSIEVRKRMIVQQDRVIIRAGGNVVLKNAIQADVVAGQSITIIEESNHSNLQADGVIMVGRPQAFSGNLVGGLVTAGQAIIAANVGTEAGAETRLRVGVPVSAGLRQRKMMQLLQNKREDQLQLGNQIGLWEKKYRQRQRIFDPAERLQRRETLNRRGRNLQKSLAQIAERGKQQGIVVLPGSQYNNLLSEIKAQSDLLKRTEADLETVVIKLTTTPDLALRQLLSKLEIAREKLRKKLARLMQVKIQQEQNWQAMPREWWLDLEVSNAGLAEVRQGLERLNAEEQQLLQLANRVSDFKETKARKDKALTVLQAELDTYRHSISNIANEEIHITVTGKLRSGTEVSLRNRRHTFTQSDGNLHIGLDADGHLTMGAYTPAQASAPDKITV